MVKPSFVNLDVECWMHPAKLGRSQPALCLYHASNQIGRPILDVLDELQADENSSQRVLTFKPSKRKGGITKLCLLLIPECDDLRVMNIAADNATATIQITAIGLQLICKAVTTWLNGGEDFGAHARHPDRKPRELGRLDRTSGELWFWGPTYLTP